MIKLLKQSYSYLNYLLKLKKNGIIIKFGAIFNKQVKFDSYVKLYEDSKVIDSEIGFMSYIGQRTVVSKSIIGKFCTIAPDVKIGLGIHPSHLVSIHPAFYSTKMQSPLTFTNENHFDEFKKVQIGNDVWIGANSIILDGVNIGNGVIIGAGAVVTKNIPDYAIVGGIPAKVIKYRFSEDEISILNKIKWWDWSLERIRKSSHLFLNPKQFFEKE